MTDTVREALRQPTWSALRNFLTSFAKRYNGAAVYEVASSIADQGARDLEDMIALAQPAQPEGWRPISEAPEPGYIKVRQVTAYRWMPYKPDGARQMKRKGRWQRVANDYGGWENADLPDGAEWMPILPAPTDTGRG